MTETESARVTSDTLLGGKVALQQPAAGYRVAIDPVLLAAAVPASDGERALDVGCGVGAGALCLAKRVTGLHVTGIEVDRSFAQLAKENAALNGLEEAPRHPGERFQAAAAETVAEELRSCLREPALLRGWLAPIAGLPHPCAGNDGGRGGTGSLARILRQDGPPGRFRSPSSTGRSVWPRFSAACLKPAPAPSSSIRFGLIIRSAGRAPRRPRIASSCRRPPSMADPCSWRAA